jgi:hypothetical protein
MIEALQVGSMSRTLTFQVLPLETRIIGLYANAVTMQEAKTALPVYDSQSQTLLEALIPACQRRVEDYVNRDTTTRVRQSLWTTPDVIIRLPYGKHQITLFEQYVNDEWVESTDYETIGLDFLRVKLRSLRPTRITYNSGGEYPIEMKAAILAEINYHFKNRNDPNESAPASMGLSIPAKNILSGL